MTPEKLRPSFTFTEERLRQLQQVVPEAFADGKINWETLREALGNYLEDEEACDEHFGLFWPGKRQARRLAALPPKGTLVPAPGEGVNEDKTHHIFIEGENLEVLKLLQKSYAGRVKMIYIDPPYNTGKDFIYQDDYSEPLEAYLKRTGQMDEEGRRLTTNTRASGRFHSNWLNMMYPRLLLARQLLREDGVIFVSIDDRELHHLRPIMNEIFGEENFIGVIKRRAARKTAFLSKHMSDMVDYVVIYQKGQLETPLSIENISDSTRPVFNKGNSVTERVIPEGVEARCPDGLYEPGRYTTRSLSFSLLEPLEIRDGKTRNAVRVQGPWRVGQELLEKTIYITKNFSFRRYITEEELEQRKAISDLLDLPSCYNEKGSEEIIKLLGAPVFDNPKPVGLLQWLVKAMQLEDKDIVLDFFAGSCTTAHAVLQQNREDGGRRRFIMVQLPEPTPPDSEARKAGFATIADIGKERIRRVIAKMQAEREGQMDFNPDEDLGFKVFKLQRSHFKEWQPVEPTTPQALDDLFSQHASPLVEGWEPQALLTEILLLEGFPLDSAVVPLDETFPANTVWRVHHPEVGHELFVCLDETLAEDTVERLKAGDLLRAEDIFICLDAALTDEAKVVLDDRLRLKVI